MKQRGITYKLSPYSLWVSGPYVLVLLAVFVLPAALGDRSTSFLMKLVGSVVVAVTVLYVMFVAYRISMGWQVAQRQKRFNAYLLALGSSSVASYLEVPAAPFSSASFNNLGSPMGKDVRNRRYTNGVQGQGWAYSDYAYDVYVRTKNAAYPFSTNYYSVFSMTLPRMVPHILFDSRRSRGRQFRTMFSGDQIHDMEGDFGKFFTVYIPYGYTIDAYSFISPEVMWAMREAANYDIEIVGDKLYLMGPLGEPNFIVSDMHAKASAIYRALADNLQTYRDERLPYAQGRAAVAPFGMRLHESSFKLFVAFFTCLPFLMIYGLQFGRSFQGMLVLEGLIVVVTTAVFGYRLYKNQREKQRLKQAGYYATRNTVFRRPPPRR